VERLNITKFDIGPKLATRFLEIHPFTWNNAPCMRIEIYGDDGKLRKIAARSTPIVKAL